MRWRIAHLRDQFDRLLQRLIIAELVAFALGGLVGAVAGLVRRRR